MFRVRAKTTDGKTLAGPTNADSFAGAAEQAEQAAEAAGKELALVSIKSVDGAGPGIQLTEPRARKEKPSKKK